MRSSASTRTAAWTSAGPMADDDGLRPIFEHTATLGGKDLHLATELADAHGIAKVDEARQADPDRRRHGRVAPPAAGARSAAA